MKSTDISNSLRTPPLDPGEGKEATSWSSWPARIRLNLARQAGRQLHSLWLERADLVRLPPARWTVSCPTEGAPQIQPPTHLLHTLPLRLTSGQVTDVLASWLNASAGLAHQREQVAFARAFFQHETMDRHAFRHALRQVATVARREAGLLAQALYREHFQQRRREGELAGWSSDSGQSLAALRDQILRVEKHPDTIWIKRRLPTRLFLAEMFGRPVVIKRHDLRTDWERLRYWFRASRARRSCAASQTLRDLGLPTPEPLAYLEVSRTCSYIVTEYLPRVLSIRAWIRSRHRTWNDTDWARLRRELLAFYVTPYERGFYHDDTKALNILVDLQREPGQRFWWIDVEGVIPGARLTRYRVLRNLAQLNGSLRAWVPEAERLAFLHGVAWYFPWLHRPRVADDLRLWTHRRLLREVRRQCGP